MMIATRFRHKSAPPQPVVRPIKGFGLELLEWDEDLVASMARWGTHEFPYHAFNLNHLRDKKKASAALASIRENKQHRYFVACEDGVPVGRLSINLKDNAGLYIWAVHVPPEHEGRGIARRMVALLMDSIEAVAPGPAFVLATHTFAERAHRTYQSLGFAVAETKWTFDTEIARELWRVDASLRAPITDHIRFRNGRWEVRTYIMRRERGSRFTLPVGGAAAGHLNLRYDPLGNPVELFQPAEEFSHVP